MLQLPPLSLYIHIPWCVKKCPYCDFNSHQKKQDLPEAQYIEALIEDLSADKAKAQGREISTIFIGGGTPSLFSASSFAYLLERIHSIIPISPSAEITMEANPGTLEYDSFAAYRNAGITRLSIGVQSFSSTHLDKLGRIHDHQEAIVAIQRAQAAGFSGLNVDLMHGLPDQSFEQAMHDLDQAIALEPNHISWYQLTIEPNTLFYSQPPVLPEDEQLWHIFTEGRKKLAESGYQQYEISGYSKQQTPCQHNLNYWRFGDYLGIGCGAHGKITVPSEQLILRTTKIKHPKGYLASLQRTTEQRQIAQDDLALEYFMNRARLYEPIPKAEFEARTGIHREHIHQKLLPAINKKLLQEDSTHWYLTEQGSLFINELLGHLM